MWAKTLQNFIRTLRSESPNRGDYDHGLEDLAESFLDAAGLLISACTTFTAPDSTINSMKFLRITRLSS
ncbi:hypothetical protein DCC62_16675 [candidate division KSB1 bacterium]|nr:MAG: hypothetical protein DCC62_16675 [candidate division KSB1 bacterium]